MCPARGVQVGAAGRDGGELGLVIGAEAAGAGQQPAGNLAGFRDGPRGRGRAGGPARPGPPVGGAELADVPLDGPQAAGPALVWGLASACRAGALVIPSFCRWLIQGLNGSILLSRLVALTSSGAASGWRANRLMVSGSRPRMRAASRWSARLAAARERRRGARGCEPPGPCSRPHASSSPSGPGGSAAAPASCGACCPGGASPEGSSGAPAARGSKAAAVRDDRFRRIRPGCATGASGAAPAPRWGAAARRRRRCPADDLRAGISLQPRLHGGGLPVGAAGRPRSPTPRPRPPCRTRAPCAARNHPPR